MNVLWPVIQFVDYSCRKTYSNWDLLGCDATQCCGRIPFWRTLLAPSQL